MNPPLRWIGLLAVLVCGWVAGGLGYGLVQVLPPEVRRVVWDDRVRWIGPPRPAYRFYARRTFELGGRPEGGWLRISADNQYKLYINGRLIELQVKTSNSSPYRASGRNLGGQHFNDSLSYGSKVIATYQLAHSREWQLPGTIDITRYLKPGSNVVALEVQKGRPSARLAIEGRVSPTLGGSPLDLSTGSSPWKVSLLSEVRLGRSWVEPQFDDTPWPMASGYGPVSEPVYGRVSPHLFDRPLGGYWIAGAPASTRESWLRTTWRLKHGRLRGYLRFAADGAYEVSINGMLLDHFEGEEGTALHTVEVSNFLHVGDNLLEVHLAQPLQPFPHEAAPRLFLDGWVEDGTGNVLTPVSTDASWRTASRPDFAPPQPAVLLGPPRPETFARTYEGDGYLRNYPDILVHTAVWRLGGMLAAALLAVLVGGLRGGQSWQSRFERGAILFFPAALAAGAVGLLEHRYAEAQAGLLFVQPGFLAWEAAGLAGVFAVTLAVSFLWKSRGALPQRATALSTWPVRLWLWNRDHPWLLLGATLLCALVLRVYRLDLVAYDSDENTSLDATRGILRTGLPVATSGILYSRGPVFHYLLALWLRLVGDSIANARLLAALFGTATLLFVFLLTRRLTGNVWLALLCTLLLAVDPWEVFYSRNNRFYQMTQFGIVAATWLFYPAFVDGRSRLHQYLFFGAMLFSLLTQEVTLTLLPAYLLGFLCFYRPFELRKDWPIVACALLVLEFYALDILIALWLHLTPWVVLSSTTEGLMKLHITDVTVFLFGLFVGNNRINVIYSLFFFLGLAEALRRRDGRVVFVHGIVLLGLGGLTVLVMANGARYFYPLYPLFVLLAVVGASRAAHFVGEYSGVRLYRLLAYGWCALLLGANLEWDRWMDSYDNEYARRSPDVFEYIKSHRRPGDIVIANLPSASAVNLGGVNYYLPPNGQPPLDGLYRRDGRVIDRWGGGIVISNSDQLSHILETSERVWIHLDDNVRPGESDRGQFYDFFSNLGEAKFESYGVRLRLWQKEDGVFPHLPNEGKDLGMY